MLIPTPTLVHLLANGSDMESEKEQGCVWFVPFSYLNKLWRANKTWLPFWFSSKVW
jgi:hypothetical protein